MLDLENCGVKISDFLVREGLGVEVISERSLSSFSSFVISSKLISEEGDFVEIDGTLVYLDTDSTEMRHCPKAGSWTNYVMYN